MKTLNTPLQVIISLSVAIASVTGIVSSGVASNDPMALFTLSGVLFCAVGAFCMFLLEELTINMIRYSLVLLLTAGFVIGVLLSAWGLVFAIVAVCIFLPAITEELDNVKAW